jgi:4-amino-4-deoxy-L-arabinose transferase-like glycosyltransferase
MQKFTKNVLIIFSLFLIIRLIYIFRFPLFTDEASYIRWGQLMVYLPNYHWASIEIGGKPPLLFWLFGIMSLTFQNPEIAPRLISLLFSVVTFISYYFWVSRLIDKKSTLIGLIIMTISPLFIHFQSLAIMESAVLCVTIMTLWLLYLYRISNKLIYLILLGFVIGMGFWVKTNTLFTSLLSIVTLIYDMLMRKPLNVRNFIRIFWLILAAFITITPLVIQPYFNNIISDTNHFTLSVDELMNFPYQIWLSNLMHVWYGFAVYMGPAFYLALLIYLINFGLSRYRLLIFWSFILLVSPIFINRFMTTRYYLTAVIPLLPFVSIGVSELLQKNYLNMKYLYILSLSLTPILCIILLINAIWFFQFFPDNQTFSVERNYAFSWTSGYTTKEVVSYLENKVKSPAIITVPDYQGNPTDYILAKYYVSSKFLTTFLNTKSDFNELKKIYFKYPIYFVVRKSIKHEQLSPYLEVIHNFPIFNSSDSITLYQVKNLESFR